MTKQNRKFFLIAVIGGIIFLVIFGFDVATEKRSTLIIEQNQIYSFFVKELKSNNIDFIVVGKNQISFLEKERKLIAVFLEKAIEHVMPSDRTYSFPEKIQHAVVKMLKKRKYGFRKICFRGKEWLILNKNSEELDRMIDEAVDEESRRIVMDASLASTVPDFGGAGIKCRQE